MRHAHKVPQIEAKGGGHPWSFLEDENVPLEFVYAGTRSAPSHVHLEAERAFAAWERGFGRFQAELTRETHEWLHKQHATVGIGPVAPNNRTVAVMLAALLLSPTEEEERGRAEFVNAST